jgi:hypothetical protein
MLRNDATAETAVGKRFRLTCWPECALGSITAHGEFLFPEKPRQRRAPIGRSPRSLSAYTRPEPVAQVLQAVGLGKTY